MKELIKTAIVLVLVILAAVVVITTKGHDTLDTSKFKLNKSFTEDQFSYSVVDSSFNGIYQSNVNSNTYIICGKREEGSYRVYFVKKVGIKSVVLRLDDLLVDANGEARFSNNDGVSMLAYFIKDSNQIIIKGAIGGVGDKSISGNYNFVKGIRVFALSEMEI